MEDPAAIEDEALEGGPETEPEAEAELGDVASQQQLAPQRSST